MENKKYQIGNIIIGRSLIYEYPEYGGNYYEIITKIIDIEYPKFTDEPLYVIEPKCFRSKLWEEDILTIIEDKTNMNIKDVAKLMSTFAEIYPNCEVTFANNKVLINTIQYDAKSNSINLR